MSEDYKDTGTDGIFESLEAAIQWAKDNPGSDQKLESFAKFRDEGGRSMIYLVLQGSPAEKALVRSLPIKPGTVIRCTRAEFESFKNDFVAIQSPENVNDE